MGDTSAELEIMLQQIQKKVRRKVWWRRQQQRWEGWLGKTPWLRRLMFWRRGEE